MSLLVDIEKSWAAFTFRCSFRRRTRYTALLGGLRLRQKHDPANASRAS